LFSDEASIELSKGKKQVWVFRTSSQKWDTNMIDPAAKGKQLSVMIWGAINLLDGKLKLGLMERDTESFGGGYTAGSYIKILDENLLPAYYSGYQYQQDNARIHIAKKTQEYLESHGIWTIVWPAYSLDLNLIEHVWAKLKEILYERYPELLFVKGKAEKDIKYLFKCLLNAWEHLLMDYIYSCIGSMQARC
jgi:transposase